MFTDKVNGQKLAYPANYLSNYWTNLLQIVRIGRHMGAHD